MDNQKSTIQRTDNKEEKQNKNITIHKQTQIMYMIRHEPSYKQLEAYRPQNVIGQHTKKVIQL